MSDRAKITFYNFMGGVLGSAVTLGIAIGIWQSRLEAVAVEVKTLKAHRENDRAALEEMRGDVKVIRTIIEERFPRRPLN